MKDIVQIYAKNMADVRQTITNLKGEMTANAYDECVVLKSKTKKVPGLFSGLDSKIFKDYYAKKIPVEKEDLLDFYKDVFPTLITQGVEAMISHLRDVYWREVKGQPAPPKKQTAIATPSP